MSVIYGDNFLHHSQSFRIMVKGWKWDPRSWYDLIVIQLAINTQNVMQIFACRPQL